MAYTDPSDGGTLDLAAGALVTESIWDAVRRDILYLGGTDGSGGTGLASVAKFANSSDAGKKVQFGSVSVTVASGTRNGSASVSFGSAFGATPKVIANGDVSGGSGPTASELPAGSTPSLIGASGFTASVYLFTTAGGNRTVTVHYIAIGS